MYSHKLKSLKTAGTLSFTYYKSYLEEGKKKQQQNNNTKHQWFKTFLLFQKIKK